MVGHLELAASAAMSALGVVAQSVAARRADRRPGNDPGLLARLAADRLYLLGFAAQVGGFALAFLARSSLPLYLVQAGSSCAVGLATAFGVLVLGWQVRAAELAVLGLMALGLLLLVAAATPSQARDIPVGVGCAVLGLPLLAAVLVLRARRAAGVVGLAVLAGGAFAVVAITSRTLADGPLLRLPLQPLSWLMVAAALVGQACMAVALQRGSATSAVAAMDATTVVLTSVVGIATLGDRIAPGREWWVVAGVSLVVVGVLALGSVRRDAPAAVVAREVG
ncbi:hypothetical protein [Saccharothrix coeruleofusca]|uniref:Magnesium transporter NIPA n=1 Tax=Saccharothrix coeruleofusca TaxID=33919 RepID=A0A918EG16_9PSEU|nr:hypothetical protein [Saccharothrix coeruleofusca]MBP2335416.1 drug/metabolite transporter (DMT)-like permease [Saccharothrix coeruleofusca]GGP77680.1 hypothetical protein GCM10010185_59320 [Saccharothrix coeruleofusca]